MHITRIWTKYSGKINEKLFWCNHYIFYYCSLQRYFNNRKMSKQLYTLEFPVRCSPSILYEFLSTPAGLGEWFADKVDERDNIFYFGWNGSFEKAEVVESERINLFAFTGWLLPKKNILNSALKNQRSPTRPYWW